MQSQKWKKEFRERFDRHAEELRGLYMELYYGDEQAWDYILRNPVELGFSEASGYPRRCLDTGNRQRMRYSRSRKNTYNVQHCMG